MPWVRLEESFAEHPKVIGLSDSAFRTHVAAICYCNRHLTDGHVPLALGKDHAAELIDAGVWHENGSGYLIHDFLNYQPSREEVLAEREKARERMKKNRSGDVRPNTKRTTGEVQLPRTRTPSSSVEAKASTSRKRDDIWDAFVELLRTEPSTSSERGRWNKGISEIRAAGGTGEEVKRRVREYQKRWPDVSVTVTAISANWGSLKPKVANIAPPCPECGVGGNQHMVDCPAIAITGVSA